VSENDETFDIYRRLKQGPVLVEAVPGLEKACDRMKAIAKEKAGVRYFVSNRRTRDVVAEIDATKPVKRKRRRVVDR
jgi:hypothetical protein